MLVTVNFFDTHKEFGGRKNEICYEELLPAELQWSFAYNSQSPGTWCNSHTLGILEVSLEGSVYGHFEWSGHYSHQPDLGSDARHPYQGNQSLSWERNHRRGY